MTDYKKLVEALRSASTVSTAWEKLMRDAAAAIEALQAEVPKRGKIVRCGECKHRTEIAPTGWHPCADMAVNDDWFCADGEREAQE